MKDEYTYTQLAPPPPPKVKARAPSLKIFLRQVISQVFRVTIIPYQQGLQWFEKNIQSMMYKKLICLYVPLGGITS